MSEARFLSISVVGLALLAGLSTVSIRRGAALYQGKEPLHGRIRGHDDFLPPSTVRCTNCHSAKSTSRLSGAPAPQIDRAWLTEMRQRHGGPPSGYDQTSFCTLLRRGIDPVHVLIAREMPTYDLSDEQCVSLWIYSIAKGDADEKH